jgi:hypothetical protein
MITNSILKAKVLIIACIYTLNGCTQDTIQTQTIYDGCCGTEPKVYEIEDHKVYIPNVITPNSDGINDAFYPISNQTVEGKFKVARFYIYDDTTKLIFVRQGLGILESEGFGFKGVAWTQPHKPQITKTYDYTGKFKYTFEMGFLLKDGTWHFEEVEGEGCVVRCDDDASVLKNKEGCYFPMQGTGGEYDPLITINEDKCIK